jgi:phosphoribosyl-AMP cyclohydrolase / phosphoribosyl-ATP pyrophosphohydrolase
VRSGDAVTDEQQSVESTNEREPVALADIEFDERGLIPAVVQDVDNDEVLMVAWMNLEAIQRTLMDGRTWFFSRSRRELWPKGETSGHIQHVDDIKLDCDADTILLRVHQVGAACHTGERTCFHRSLAVD